jgi:PAS domain S-box-containing protein
VPFSFAVVMIPVGRDPLVPTNRASASSGKLHLHEGADCTADPRKFFNFIMAASVVAVALGIIAMLGWALGEPTLTKVLPGTRAMQPLTAAGLIVAGCAVGSLAWTRPVPAAVASFLLILLGLVGLVQTLAAADFGIDYALFESMVRSQEPLPSNPGRPAPLVCGLFLLFAVATLAIGSASKARRRIAIACASTGMIISLLSLLGFILFAGDPVYGVDAALVMPLHTAVGLSAVFPAILLLGAEGSWVGNLIGNTWRGRISRLLLTTAIVPVVVAWLAQRGHQAGFYGPDLRMLFIATGAVLLIALLAIVSGSLLGRERDERDELVRAVDLSPNLLLNEDREIIYWSLGCERIYGWTSKEVLGRQCEDLFGDCGSCDLTSADAGPWQAELQQKTKDGRILSVWTTRVRYYHNGSPAELLFMTDVTAQREAQAAVVKGDANIIKLQHELEEVSRLNSMGEMAASLAHELNQPLTAAANFLGAAELTLKVRGEDEPPNASRLIQVRKALNRGKTEVLRAGDIVRRLREFIVHGDADMKGERLSLIVGDAVALGQATTHRRAIPVSYQLASDADYVLVDRVPIQQVLVNLIRNAAEAMAHQTNPKPALKISSRRRKDGFSEVSVTDNGPGIPEEIGSNLFAPFSTSKPTGLGVGLSICKRIVESHGGQLKMVPRPTRGTTFKFTLPILSKKEAKA